MTKAGIEFPEVIDLVSHDPMKEKWELTIVESGVWDGSTGRLQKLQQKLNNYLKFALDGEMQRTYPESAGKPVTVRLDLYQRPDQRTLDFILRARGEMERDGVELVLDIDIADRVRH